ncbi:metallophosphoesterase [Faecalibacillus intestinalis]|uniref:Metallophosphoesterase n=1 Tax=Faecalibacillus intestinalis TaxID=1982626 RepID=A0AAP2UJT1_9FIRM|nr:FN3 domain-containing metallophosphoesterase family protein [Faecalibacillus intestinalis]MCB8593960.1 metallophosphoesterase [Faecalibacillus intestinalis]MCB8614771.1 metallophosphoesterase [Faecalibacillus intestinalis]MCG4715419.1 metallophosphoesterase [Faecalibacillus intestinalis]MCG4756633.1 metallophosphoesterase [Faecalibacillus intestinalis]MCQ5063222.1 metallophosphoesterase [Faecalibacillus intestinalis]
MKKNKLMKVSMAALAVAMGIGYLRPTVLVTPVHAEEQTVSTTSTAATSQTLIDGNTKWKYLDTNEDPGTREDLQSWTKAIYNDSSWKEGAGSFGAKNGKIADLGGGYTPKVLLNQYQDNGDNIPAYFFRTKVNIENLNDIKSLTGKIVYDDHAIIYINGVEVYNSASSVEADNSTNMYYSSSAHQDAPGVQEFDISGDTLSNLIGNEILTQGENVIAIELHNDRSSSSDIYLAVDNLTANYTEVEEETSQNDVILTVGSDETKRNLTWYADVNEAGTVQVAKAGNTDGFPKKYQEFNATSTAANDEGFYTNQATITGLEANTKYVYRLVNGETVSETYSFETGSTKDFTFALVGDPQIGASGNSTSDTENWGLTVDYIVNTLDPDFLLSAGDQVNTASSESQYEGYLNEKLASLASATTIGNHDSGSDAYAEHYNLPNESTTYGTTTAGGDYYFVYNNTLFIGINSNDQSTAEHKEFIQQAINANPDVTWKTVFFHHSVYSTASHWNNSDIVDRRNELPVIFDELDIDVVLMGHDHVYTRSKIMNVGTPTDQGSENEVYNPDGILYLTANSASGSKYYNLQDGAIEAGYAAKYDQSKRRTATEVTVTENSYTLTTYFADDNTLLDTYTIYKTNKTELETVIKSCDTIFESNAVYIDNSWSEFEKAYRDASTVFANEEAKQEEIDDACKALNDAIAKLVIVDKTKLEALINQKEELTLADYTTDSWSVLEDAYASARTVYADINAEQDAIDSAVESLENALASLVKVEVKDDESVEIDKDVETNTGTDVETNTSTDVETNTDTDEKASSAVETGDATNVAAMGLMMVAAAGTALIASKKKKESEVK